MANLVTRCESVLDIGYSHYPNKYLSNPTVVGLDQESSTCPSNYSQSLVGKVGEIARILPSQKFDAIVAGELIEHLENPIEFIKECHSATKNGGLLVLSTPNPNSLIERVLTLSLNDRYFYTEEHIMLFPQRWLVRMMTYAGYKNIKLYSGGFPVPKIGLVPFPRPWCYQTIALGEKA